MTLDGGAPDFATIHIRYVPGAKCVELKSLKLYLNSLNSTRFNSDAAVLERIATDLSARAGESLIEEIDLMGPVRLTQVEEAQQGIIRTIRQLEERGEIMVRRGGDDEFVD